VKVVPLQSLSNAAAALKGETVDAALLPVSTARKLMDDGGATLLGWVGDETPWQLGAVFASPKTVGNRPLVTKLPMSPAYLLGIFNLRGVIVPLIDIAITEGRRPGLLPKHVVVASLRSENHQEDVRIGIASDEVIGTYSVKNEDFLEQAPENVPHCVGMLRHDDRLALVIDLRRLLEVFPGPSI